MIAASRVNAVLALFLLTLPAAHGAARTAVYVRDVEEPSYPGEVRRIELTLLSPKEGVGRLIVRFHSTEGAFGFTASGAGALSLVTADRRLDLDRYVLETSGRGRLEFRRRETGRAMLPFSFELQADLFLPLCRDDHGAFLPSTTFLGEPFTLAESSVGEEDVPFPEAKVIALSDDLLVGTSRHFRDVDGERIPEKRFIEDMNLDYTYRPLDDADLGRMLASGFNYFDRVLPEQLAYLIDKPVFFDLAGFGGYARPVFPEIFYHPGFLGVEDFLDEPAYIFWEDAHYEDYSGLNPAKDLPAMAGRQEERTASEYGRTTRGRMAGLVERLEVAGIHLEGIELVEPPFPIWEEFYSTACYQLHVPVSGFIQEGRYRHPEAVDLLNNTFRIRLPRKPETMFRFYFSFLRGAARVFDKDWGMSIYGQADPEVSALGMKMAYDRGARYIFFWSSDRDHHLPFEEQLALAEELREHVRDHPRGPRRALIRRAEDAIVLPYGFTFSISDWQKRRMADLWHRTSFPIEGGAMPDGTPYYSVLRCAAEKMEELIDQGKEFDVVIDVPELGQAGYLRLHRVLPEARRRALRYPWWIHYKLHILLAALVAFLVVFRAYRIVRWFRRRKAKAAGQAP